MKKSISEWSFPGDMPLRARMELAKDAGFEGIEVALNEDDAKGAEKKKGLVCLDSSAAQIKKVRALAEEVGIELSGLACGLYWSYSLTADDRAERAKARQVSKALLRQANKLGVDGVLLIPGCVYASFIPDSKVVPYDVVYERSQAELKKLAPLAEKLDVHIGVEYVWNWFLLSPLELARYLDEVGSTHVGAYLDTGNMMNTGFPEQWIRILGPRIKRVHFKDFRRSVGDINGFCDLLEGDVNWPEVMQALKDVGYDGWVTAEMIPPYTHYPEQIIYNTSAAMDRILGR